MEKLPAQIIQQIETALAKGNNILAIKMYKEATNVGLLEAKQVIDDWDKQKSTLNGMTEGELWEDKFAANTQAVLTTAMIEEKVYAYLKDDQKMEAIKWVKNVNNWGLKEAKDYVDSLAEKRKVQAAIFPNEEKTETNTQYSFGEMPSKEMLSEESIEKQIRIYLNNNQKLEAIKWLKEGKNMDLKAAKDYVEMWEEKQNAEIFNESNSYKSTQTPVIESSTAHEGKIEFHLSPITYPENNEKNTASIKNRLAILFLLTALAYLVYKLIST